MNWVLYDAACRYCTALARWARPLLRRRGFVLAPLQSLWVPAALGILPRELLKELRVFTSDGRLYGGADAVVFLARRIWWAWPLWAVAQIPGALRPLGALYRWIAAHRFCGSAACALPGHAAGRPRKETEER